MFNLKLKNYIFKKPKDKDEIKKDVFNKYLAGCNYKPFSYCDLQEEILYKFANNKYFNNYYSTRCEGINEIVTFCKLNIRADFEVYIGILTTCDLHNWVTRDYGSDTVKVFLMLNYKGNTYIRHLRRMKRVNSLIKNLKEYIQEVAISVFSDINDFLKTMLSSYRNETYFSLDYKTFNKQKTIYNYAEYSYNNKLLRIDLIKPFGDYGQSLLLDKRHYIYNDEFIIIQNYRISFEDITFSDIVWRN